jgi:hypothetical protein
MAGIAPGPQIFGVTMTELERARDHLQRCQGWLGIARRQNSGDLIGLMNVKYATEDVLAALSWVWDAQERDRWARIHGDGARIMETSGRLSLIGGLPR